MARSTYFSALISLLAVAGASPHGYPHHDNLKSCVDYTIPVTVTSENFIWGLPKFKNNYDVADLFTNLGSRTAGTDFVPFNNILNQTASYEISGRFCTPVHPTGGKEEIVLLASHGVNFDKRYVLCFVLFHQDI
jgi:hypothetical protein